MVRYKYIQNAVAYGCNYTFYEVNLCTVLTHNLDIRKKFSFGKEEKTSKKFASNGTILQAYGDFRKELSLKDIDLLHLENP